VTDIMGIPSVFHWEPITCDFQRFYFRKTLESCLHLFKCHFWLLIVSLDSFHLLDIYVSIVVMCIQKRPVNALLSEFVTTLRIDLYNYENQPP